MTDDSIDPEKLSALQTEVAKLPRSAEAPDAWPDIRAAIERDQVTPLHRRIDRAARWQHPGFMAAAAVILIAVSSAITAAVMTKRQSAQVAVVSDARRSSNETPVSLAQFTAKENDYIRSANQLSQILESEQGRLAPETVAKLRESIAVIDAAILEARQALAADPANKELIEILSSSYDKKLDLLRRTTALVRS